MRSTSPARDEGAGRAGRSGPRHAPRSDRSGARGTGWRGTGWRSVDKRSDGARGPAGSGSWLGGARCRSMSAALAGAVLACVLLAAPARADSGPTLSLSAQAHRMVRNDEMTVRLAIERDGPSVGPLNREVLAGLEAAIAQAKQVSGVDARLGSIYTGQRHGSRGEALGWRVRGEVVLRSRDMEVLGALAGRLAERMQLAGVSFALSREVREVVERELLREAALAFRQRAADAAAAFGYTGYQIRELSLDAPPRMPVRSFDAPRVAMAEAAQVPTEGGESQVTVTVGGSVALE